MIINGLQGAYNILPIEMMNRQNVYVSHKEYAQHLKKGAFIGFYSKDNKFIVNKGLTSYYRPIFNKIAESLSGSTKDSAYQTYKIATIEKNSKQIQFDCLLEHYFPISHANQNFVKMAKFVLGVDLFIVDMHGPYLDIFVPKAIHSLLPPLNKINKPLTQASSRSRISSAPQFPYSDAHSSLDNLVYVDFKQPEIPSNKIKLAG